MAMEQMSVGSLMHAEILWKTAVDTADKEDATSLLQNRFVALFMERLLKRERYLGALTGRHLSACAVLLKATGLEESLLATATEESLSHAEQIVNNEHSVEDSEEQGLSEKHVQDLISVRIFSRNIITIEKVDRNTHLLSHFVSFLC